MKYTYLVQTIHTLHWDCHYIRLGDLETTAYSLAPWYRLVHSVLCGLTRAVNVRCSPRLIPHRASSSRLHAVGGYAREHHAARSLSPFHCAEQLSQQKRQMLHVHTQTNLIMVPCMHPGTSREVNEASRAHTYSRPCAFEEKNISKKKRKTKKSRRTQNTPRNSQQPGHRDHFETARDETCPTRQPILARFHRSRVCGNRPRATLEISKNDECYAYTH